MDDAQNYPLKDEVLKELLGAPRLTMAEHMKLRMTPQFRVVNPAAPGPNRATRRAKARQATR